MNEIHNPVMPKSEPKQSTFTPISTKNETPPSKVFKNRCPECNVKFTTKNSNQILCDICSADLDGDF
jgi:hypothetical protein